MFTKAWIGVDRGDNIVESIFCQKDGDKLGKQLLQKHNSEFLVNALIKEGNRFSLDQRFRDYCLEFAEDFDECCGYGRDRGDVCRSTTIRKINDDKCFLYKADYIYLWRNGTWWFADTSTKVLNQLV